MQPRAEHRPAAGREPFRVHLDEVDERGDDEEREPEPRREADPNPRCSVRGAGAEPGEHAASRALRRARPDEPPREIVGIVANVRDSSLDREAQPANYVPITQLRMPLQLGWLVRTQGDPESLRPRIEQELLHASGGVPVTTVGEMDP